MRTLLIWSVAAAAATVTAGLSISVAPPAQAAGFDFAFHTRFGGISLNDDASGRARIDGRVQFASRRRLTYDVWELTDQCNSAGTNDGLGAVLTVGVRLRYEGGAVGVGQARDAAYFRACDGGFSYGYDIGYRAPADAVIEGVTFYLSECSRSRCPGGSRNEASSRFIRNPKT